MQKGPIQVRKQDSKENMFGFSMSGFFSQVKRSLWDMGPGPE